MKPKTYVLFKALEKSRAKRAIQHYPRDCVWSVSYLDTPTNYFKKVNLYVCNSGFSAFKKWEYAKIDIII